MFRWNLLLLLILMGCDATESKTDLATNNNNALPNSVQVSGTLKLDESTATEVGDIPLEGKKVKLVDNSGYVVSEGTLSKSGTFNIEVEANGLSLTKAAYVSGNKFLYVSSIFLNDKKETAVGARNQIIISPSQLDVGEDGQALLAVGDIKAKKVGAIVGKITLETEGDPTGIDVYVPGTTHIAKTDEKGNFLLGFLPPGNYTLRADRDGFMSQVWEGIQIKRNQTAKLENSVLSISKGASITSFGLTNGVSLSPTSKVTLTLSTIGASKYKISQFSDYNDSLYNVIDNTEESVEVNFFLSGEDGPKTIYLMVADNDGNFAEKKIEVYLDRNKPKSPSFTITSSNYNPETKYPKSGYTNSSNVIIKTENCNDVKSLYITENESTTPTASDFVYDCQEAKTTGVTYTLSDGEGSKTLHLWSLDYADQISDQADTSNNTVVLDISAPIVTLAPSANSDNGSVVSNASIEITLSTNEDVSFFYNFDSSHPSTTGAQVLATFDSPAKLVIIASASLSALAYDDAGNVSPLVEKDFYIDRDGPILGSVTTSETLLNNILIPLNLSAQNATFFTVSESISTLLEDSWISFSAPNMVYNYELENTDDGVKTLYVAFKDDAGNMIGKGGEFSTGFTLDRTSPSEGKISLYQPESPTGAFNTPLAWNTEISESEVTYKVEVHADNSYSDPIRTMNTSNTTLTVTPPLSDAGTYFWRVRAEDQAGNYTNWVESGSGKNFQLAILAQAYQAKADFEGDSSTEKYFAKEFIELPDFTGDGVPEVAYSILQSDYTYGNGNACQECGIVQIYDRINDEILGSLQEGLHRSANYGHRIVSCDLNGDGQDEIVVSAPNEEFVIDEASYKDAGSIYAYSYDSSSQIFSLIDSYSNNLGATNPANGYYQCNEFAGADCVQYGYDFWPYSIEYTPWPGDKRLFGWDLSCADGQGDGADALIVGEPFYDDGTNNRGRVVQLELVSGSLSETKEILGPTDEEEAAFGSAVEYLSNFLYGSCSSEAPTLAIGSPRKTVSGDRRGSVSLYQLSAGNWSLCDTIDADSGDPSDGYYGSHLFDLGDIDQDGSVDELAISAQYGSGGTIRIFGGSSGTLLASYVDTSNGLLGYHVGPAGDFNSDGQGDLVLTAPEARVNGQWGAGSILILDWNTLDSSDNDTGTVLKTITGIPRNGARLGGGVIPIRDTAYDIHSESSSLLVSSPGKNINSQWEVGSFHEFSLIKMAPSLPSRISGTSTNAQMGRFISAISDIDGDSVSDFMIGQPGGVCNGNSYGAVSLYSVLDGKINASICDTYNDDLGLFGVWLPASTDLLFGKKGNAYVAYDYDILTKRDVSNSSDYPSIRSSTNLSWEFPYISEPHAYSGNSYTDEILLSEHTYWGSANNQGRVTLSHMDGSFDDQCEFRGNVENGKFGYSASFIRDLNGDGVREIVVGEPGTSVGNTTGRVYILDGSMASGDCLGGATHTITDSHPLTLMTIDGDSSVITTALSTEANGGFGSMVLGLPDYDESGDAKAYLYVANTNMRVTSSPSTPQYFIFRINSDDSITLMRTETGVASGMLGGNVKLIDDVNGDGLEELAISYPGGVGRLGNTGHVRIISGSGIATSSSTDDLIQMLFNPETSASNFGVSIEYGDITGDGLKDFVIGADKYDSSAYQDAGAVFTFAMEPIQE